MIVHLLELKQPLQVGEEWLEELEFREPTVAQLLATDSTETGSYAEEVALLSALCGVASVHLEKLNLQDFARCREVVQVVSLMIDYAISWDAGKAMIEEAKGLLAKQLGEPAEETPGKSQSPDSGAAEQNI